MPLAVLALGLAIVLPYAGRLGLWNDDVVQFLQPHHAAGGDPLAFVASDSTGFLLGGERPAGYLVYALARTAYLAGVSWLHWLAALSAALAAAVFARFHRHLIADEATALVAGVVVLLWPLAPLVLFWPSALHYTAAGTLSILAAELALSERRHRAWLAGAVHLLAALTLEAFVLAAPGWTLAALASERMGLVRPPREGRRNAGRALVILLTVSAMVFAWRLYVVPRWGLERLHYEADLLRPGAALRQAEAAPVSLLWPWPGALAVARKLGPAPPRLFPLLLAAAATMLALVLARGRPATLDRAPGAGRRAGRGLLEIVPGAALLAFWTAQLAFIPGLFSDPVGLSSRLAYPLKFGVAAALAGVYHLLTAAPSGVRRGVGRIAAHALLLAALVVGGRFEASVLRAHVQDWQASVARMAQIASVCGSLSPGTLVVIDTEWPTTLLRAGRAGMSHQVLSSLLIARYDDPTLRGVRRAELRVTRRGIRPLHFRIPARWFRPGEYGPVQTRARFFVPPIPSDRLVTLGRDPRGRLTIVRAFRVALHHKRHGLLRHRPERCRAGATTPSRAFCHAFPTLCLSAAPSPAPASNPPGGSAGPPARSPAGS